MRRFWLGLGVLGALLALGVWGWHTVQQVHEPLEALALAAGEAGIREDWDRAAELLDRTRDFWQEHRRVMASLTGHEAVEEADRLLAQLSLYLALEDRARFASTCRDLAVLADAQADAQSLTWWNLF